MSETVKVTVRLTPEVAKRVRAISIATERTIAGTIRYGLKEYIKIRDGKGWNP